jgi:ubiquinone/menaquinone biosynthesis C-methylase UbiE
MIKQQGNTKVLKKEIEGLFNRAASTYGSVGPSFFDYFGKKLVEFADIKHSPRVLDVATGRGAILFAAAKAIATECAFGIDLSNEMVLKTKEDACKRSISNVEISCMDAENLIYSNDSFDHVFCGFGLFFFPDPTRALTEINRVLKSEGTFCVSVWTKTDERRRWLIDLVKKHLPSETDFNESIRLLPKGFDEESKVAAALQGAGFTLQKTHEEIMEVSYSSAEEWWKTQYSHGIRSIFEVIENKLGQAGLMRFKKDVFKKFHSMQVDGKFNQQLKAIFVSAIK